MSGVSSRPAAGRRGAGEACLDASCIKKFKAAKAALFLTVSEIFVTHPHDRFLCWQGAFMRTRLRQFCCTAVLLSGLAAPTAAGTPHPSFSVTVTGQGPAMVLIPGLMSSGEVWNSTVERYRQRFTLHIVTLAGFGGPPPVGSPFLSRVRAELIVYIREQQMEKPTLVGHSLGGFMAFWIAATAPHAVGGVIAVDGVPFLPALGNPAAHADGMRAQAAQIESLYASFSADQLVAQSRMALATMITAPANVERALQWAVNSDPASTGIAVSELMTTDLRATIATITAPVLLIGATGGVPETMRPRMAAAYAAQVARLPTARVKMAEKARHFIMFDDPAFLFAAIDEFLAAGGR